MEQPDCESPAHLIAIGFKSLLKTYFYWKALFFISFYNFSFYS